MTNQFNILVGKLEQFIRRYYYNLLLKGVLLFGAGFLILFLAFVVLEYFGYFNQDIRAALFFTFLGFNAFVLIRYVLVPLLGLIRIGRRLGEEDAARLIGRHFHDEVGDKITNALQLKRYLDAHPQGMELVMAGIDQKVSSVVVVPFQKAISYKGNMKFVPFLVVPLVFGLIFFVVQPALILEPAQRIVRYDTHFKKPSPFVFSMNNEARVFRHDDLAVTMVSQGEVRPSEVFLHYNGGRFAMTAAGQDTFNYRLRNLQEPFELMVESGGFMFGPFPVEVVQKPLVHQFTVKVQSPAYTRIPVETHSNIGDLIVARGSTITWEFNTRGTGDIGFFTLQDTLPVEGVRPGVFEVSMTADESFDYQVFASNKEVGVGDSLDFFVQVVPDEYPQIEVEEHRDSVLLAHVFHQGLIQDDYGFTRLEFRYRVLSQQQAMEDVEAEFTREQVDINKELRQHDFYHHIDINTLDINKGDVVEYYFVVFDNDGLAGPKATRSQVFSYQIPDLEEMMAQKRQDNQQIKSNISSGVGEVRQARDELELLREQLLQSESMSWEQRESLKNLLDKQKQVQENFEDLATQKKENELRDEQFNEVNERLQEKQQQLQELFEEVLSDELQDLFEQIRQQLDSLSREQVFEMLDQMDFEFRDMEMQMDRALELFKQLEMEVLLQQGLELLEQTAEEQQAVMEKNTGEAESEDLSQEQEAVNEQFENVQELLEEFRQKNQELARPRQIEDTSEGEESINQDLQDALQQLQQNKQGEAHSKQQQSGQKMEQLAQQLQNMQQNMFGDQLAEDSQALRQIMENLMKSSFSQEDLMMEINKVNVNDPRFVELMQQQRKIREDLRMVEDSLVALSKRQMQIESFVTREIGEVNMNLEKALDDLINRRRYQAASRQQFVMTHLNNLALLLNESLQNMQQQMASQQGMGQGSPNSGAPSELPGMNQMQQQLNKMLQQLQQGHQPMPGETGQPMSMSEQLARMAAEQEAIRNHLRKITNEVKKDDIEMGADMEQVQKEMERTELDIVNRNITRQTLMRQERIMTRLLEHEKALLEREKEERREATTAEKYELSNPEGFFEYNRKRNREMELLRRLPPELRPYYRSLVEKYFLNVE